MKTKTCTKFDGTIEEVEIGSVREQELRKILNDMGLYENDDPNAPIDAIPFSEYMDSDQYRKICAAILE